MRIADKRQVKGGGICRRFFPCCRVRRQYQAEKIRCSPPSVRQGNDGAASLFEGAKDVLPPE